MLDCLLVLCVQDCLLIVPFYCNSPARLWVLALILSQLVFQSCQAHFQTLVLKISDVGIFCFWTITRICFFAMFCLRWFLSSNFNLDLEMIIWFGIYPSSERLETSVGLVVLFTSSVHLRDDYYHFISNPFLLFYYSIWSIYSSGHRQDDRYHFSNPFHNSPFIYSLGSLTWQEQSFLPSLQRLTTNVDKSSHLFYSAFQTKQSLLKFSLRWKFANLDVQILKTIILWNMAI